jgi:hypothetical protein
VRINSLTLAAALNQTVEILPSREFPAAPLDQDGCLLVDSGIEFDTLKIASRLAPGIRTSPSTLALIL